MTRIISGRFRGLTLSVPKKGTRPTSDRVRESLFQILEQEDVFHEANVLDLYAGSGSLGFEALSRGASHLTAVDISSGSVAALQGNRSAILRRTDNVTIEVTKKRAHTFLSSPALQDAQNQKPWDLVFIDPPYEAPLSEIVNVLEQLMSFISDDAVVVLEQASRSPFTIPTELYRAFLERNYGDTTISLLTKVSALTS